MRAAEADEGGRAGGFDSGASELDEWLARFSWQDQRADNSVTHVSALDGRVVDYYAIAVASVTSESAPVPVMKGAPRQAPCLLLARLAVDRSVQGFGLGRGLLIDALRRTVGVADSVLRRDPESPARRYGRHMGGMSETRAGAHALPDFERPPLTEVALGVVFEPVEIGAVGLGELYQRWRGEFPKVQEHAAIPPLFEPPQPGLGLVVEVDHPPMRLWMLNETEDQLVQAQRDRLGVNWRRIGDGDYPRYHALRALLGRQLADFWSFLRDRAVPLPPPVAVEATYVNTIEAAGLADFLVAVNPLPERLGLPTEALISLVFDTPSGTPAPQRVALSSTRDRSEDARYVLRVSVLGQLSAWDELDRSIAAAHEQAVGGAWGSSTSGRPGTQPVGRSSSSARTTSQRPSRRHTAEASELSSDGTISACRRGCGAARPRCGTHPRSPRCRSRCRRPAPRRAPPGRRAGRRSAHAATRSPPSADARTSSTGTTARSPRHHHGTVECPMPSNFDHGLHRGRSNQAGLLPNYYPGVWQAGSLDREASPWHDTSAPASRRPARPRAGPRPSSRRARTSRCSSCPPSSRAASPPSPAFTTAAARAQQADLQWLLGQDRVHRQHDPEQPGAPAAELRAVINAWDDPGLDGPPPPLSEVEAGLARAEQLRRLGRYDGVLAARLPGLLRALYVHARDSVPGTQAAERVRANLWDAYSVVQSVANRYGLVDVVGQAVDRHLAAAGLSGDPLRPAVAAYRRAGRQSKRN